MASMTLVVPVEVEALAVNDYVLQNQPFRRWQPAYTNLNRFSSAEPDPADHSSGFSTANAQGVYLHWQLPAALRHGEQRTGDESPSFPLVPNRWIVIRYSGTPANRTVKAFIVESDAPGSESSAPYVLDSQIVQAWANSQDPLRQQAGKRLLNKKGFLTDVIGQSFPLNKWMERGIETLFLTAVAPGNALFHAYQSHCQQVFSFHDSLEGVADESTLSYLVAGWFSNEKNDPLYTCRNGYGGPESYSRMLGKMGWQDRPDSNDLSDSSPISSIYHGQVIGVTWKRSGVFPTARDTHKENSERGLHVAIGYTSADAFATLVERQLHARAGSGDESAGQLLSQLPKIGDWLRSFQYGFIDLWNEPSGAEKMEERFHQEWFSSKPGGYLWTTVPLDESKAQTEPASRESWLAELNNVQKQFDETVREMQAEQWRLYACWWKYGKFKAYPSFAKPDGVTEEQFRQALSAQRTTDSIDSIPDNVYSLMKQVQALAAQLPQPIKSEGYSDEEALTAGIAAFEDNLRREGKLAVNRKLKSVPAARYYRANDPVLFISGAGATMQLRNLEAALHCRTSTQLVSGFAQEGRRVEIEAELNKQMPKLPVEEVELAIALQGNFMSRSAAEAIASTIVALHRELILLDPDQAASLNASCPTLTREWLSAYASDRYIGALPAIVPKPWAQPWKPFQLKWNALWYPMDSTVDGQSCWEFDGTTYRYKGGCPTPKGQMIGGDILLTPQTSYIFRDRLKKYAEASDESSEQLLYELDSLIDAIDGWDFISQKLSGFNEQISRRDVRINRAPDEAMTFTFQDGRTSTLAELVGGQFEMLPYIRDTDSHSAFQAIRQGQFIFTYLALYDGFGQVLEIVGDSGLSRSDVFAPILADELTPDGPIVSNNPQRFVQLCPRPLQHARLDFHLVDAQDPSRTYDSDAETNPIAGWVLPNHLERSVQLFDAAGLAIGMLREWAIGHGKRQVELAFVPQGSYSSMENVEGRSPHMARMAQGIIAKGMDALRHFIDHIDTTLWTVDPFGSRSDEQLSVLAGRPLALARTRLSFDLDGPPLTDCNWKDTFRRRVPDYMDRDFDVRLGHLNMRQDGLVGYYSDFDFTTFHHVTAARHGENSDMYSVPIQPGRYIRLKLDERSSADVFLLMEPRSVVHAVSGIVPTVTVRLPEERVNAALKAMQVSFTVSALLTSYRQHSEPDAVTETPQSLITLPLPAERNGKWNWVEKRSQSSEDRWQSCLIASVDETAELHEAAPCLRDGSMVFVTDLKE